MLRDRTGLVLETPMCHNTQKEKRKNSLKRKITGQTRYSKKKIWLKLEARFIKKERALALDHTQCTNKLKA